jgi:ABC-type sugar transport system substrate-binding protein
LIARKPAGIAIFPADDQSLNEPLQRHGEGIPVIVVNHDVNDPTPATASSAPTTSRSAIGGRRLSRLHERQG